MEIKFQHDNSQTKYYEFRQKKLFIDCYLRSGPNLIPCHKLILARYSKFFFRIFCEDVSSSRETVIKFDPGNTLADIVDFLYSGQIDITIDNLAQITANAEFYEIENLVKIADSALLQLLSADNIFGFLNSCKMLEIRRFNQKVENFIVKNRNEFETGQLIHIPDSEVFSNVLKSLPNISADEKIGMIDKFAEKQTQLTKEEKDYLTSVIDFKEDSYKHLLYHKCDWLSSNIQRSLISTIINERRNNIVFYKNCICLNCSDKVGKWKAFSNISNIFHLRQIPSNEQQAQSDQESNAFDLIQFVCTLDGMIKPINPIKYGFLSVENTAPLAHIFGGCNIFEKNGYFASNLENGIFPSISFSFNSNDLFVINSIELEEVTHSCGNGHHNSNDNSWKPKRPKNGAVLVSFERKGNGNDFEEKFLLDCPSDKNFIKQQNPSQSVKLTMIVENESGGWIFRFTTPIFFGYFV